MDTLTTAGRRAWQVTAINGVTGVVVAVVVLLAGAPWWACAGSALSVTGVGLLWGVLVLKPRILAELAEEHRDSVRLSVAAERLRFARDLHDLLGYGLSALTLKAEVADRLLGHDQARTRRELREILIISRQALADVRTVAERYRDLTLAEELSSVRDVLRSARIHVYVSGDPGPLDRTANTLLATVLREGITNLLRHSNATVCRIRLWEQRGAAQLVVCNDGARDASGDPREKGSGLDGLARRLEAAGGAVSTVVNDEGWFFLVAECPAVVGAGLEVSGASRSPGRSGSRRADCVR